MVDVLKPPAAAPTQAPAPAAQPATQVPVQAPVKAPETPKPAAQPAGATPVPAQEDKLVPITALHEEREKRQQLQSELEALRKIAGQNVLFDVDGKPVSYQQPQQQQPQRNFQQELDKLWETDPRKAVQAEIYSAMAWRDQQDAQVDTQENSVSQKYPDFQSYRGEVRQYIRTLPLEARGNPGVVELAYYVVKGQKVDNIIAKTREQIEQEYRQKIASGEFAQGMPSGTASSVPTPQGVQLSEDQKKVADAMNIPYAEYAKWVR